MSVHVNKCEMEFVALFLTICVFLLTALLGFCLETDHHLKMIRNRPVRFLLMTFAIIQYIYKFTKQAS